MICSPHFLAIDKLVIVFLSFGESPEMFGSSRIWNKDVRHSRIRCSDNCCLAHKKEEVKETYGRARNPRNIL
jgi:hypothetical protein